MQIPETLTDPSADEHAGRQDFSGARGSGVSAQEVGSVCDPRGRPTSPSPANCVGAETVPSRPLPQDRTVLRRLHPCVPAERHCRARRGETALARVRSQGRIPRPPRPLIRTLRPRNRLAQLQSHPRPRSRGAENRSHPCSWASAQALHRGHPRLGLGRNRTPAPAPRGPTSYLAIRRQPPGSRSPRGTQCRAAGRGRGPRALGAEPAPGPSAGSSARATTLAVASLRPASVYLLRKVGGDEVVGAAPAADVTRVRAS